MIVCPAGEQVAIGFLCRGALTTTLAINIVIKMMSFMKIFKHFLMSSQRAPALTPALNIRCLLWPEQMSHRIKNSAFLILKTRFLKSAMRAVLLPRSA